MKKKPIIISVTGGKGGTGKTLCAVNLAIMFKNEEYKVLLIDGDAENPNTYLLLDSSLENKKEVLFFKPDIIDAKCNKCGLCAKNCAPHALLYVEGSVPIPILAVCSGCRLCYKICPSKAIEQNYKTIGWTYSITTRNIDLLIGELKPGEARSASIIEDLIKMLDEIIKNNIEKYDIVIMDTAPGAHCDVEALINRADIVIPVTEPTKFGKLDLERIIDLIKLLEKEYKVIVNRSSLLGFKDQFLRELKNNNINILGDIPLDDDIVNSYCLGKPLMDSDSHFNEYNPGYKAFKSIYNNLKIWLEDYTNKKGV